ncbi:DUF3368 domain-containing protein [Thiohalocapsa sp. ML1]|uniref:DUF3368 domain-containing protein n=1 Tax=Thiohalocapsa sp. ML1 TaxID=1431688 RepID=UPI0007323C51|nr:DUF3368 domain-containing protein [Thiohalocapsa sp. ML1]
MSGVVIADAGPLIALARIEHLSLLPTPYGTVTVPEAVLAELRLDSDRPGARLLSAALGAGVIEARALPPHLASDLAQLSLVLDAGEAAAILLAEALSCRFLLIDERRGRAVARRRGVPVVGLAGVLLAAQRHGLVPSVAPLLAALAEHGYRLSDSLVREVLRLAGETGATG